MVELIGYDGLPALVDVDVPNGLLSRLVELGLCRAVTKPATEAPVLC
jgi:hypothetical protein